MRIRRTLAIFTTALVMTVVPGLEAQAHASADRAAEMVIAKTGRLGTELPSAGGRADTGYRLQPAETGGRALRTWVQRESGGMRFVSELTPGDSQGTFP